MSAPPKIPDAFKVLVRLSAQVAILSLLVALFSTWLWIGIPVYGGITVGHVVVSILLALLASRTYALASPLASVITSGLGGRVEKAGLLIIYTVRFLVLAILYLGYKWLFTFAAARAGLLPRDAATLYDAAFVLAAAYLAYSVVKVFTG